MKDCENKVKAKGYCNKHYLRVTKHGSPFVVKNRQNIKIEVKEENGCLICISHKKDRNGYPNLTKNGKHYLVHRFIFEQMFGEIQKGLVVRHKCDNPACINPEHLELGTFLDNMNDRIIRGRTAKGERSGLSKLKENEVIEIKKMIADGKRICDISKKFNTTASNVCDIKYSRSWKHINIS